MKRNHLIATIFLLFISLGAWSQVDRGIELFLLEDFEQAKKAFEQSTSQSADISYYYLGEIALRNNKAAEAASYFEKGIAADPNAVLSRIGKTKLELKSSPNDLKKEIRAITNKNKKRPEVFLAAAKAYLDNNMSSEVTDALSGARKANKAYPYIYIFEGDLLKAKNQPGNAATQYEQAINFDPKSTIAYIKNSMVYESISPATAINTLKAGLEAVPNSLLIRRYLARSYYRNGIYDQAIAEYEKLKAGEVLEPEDERNYAASLYFAGKYNEALAQLTELSAKDSNQLVINRLLMYTQEKLKNWDAVIAAGEKLFSLPTNRDTVKYLVTDYTIYAEALMSKKQIDKAIEYYRKAIEMESEEGQSALSKEVASRLANADRTPEAAEFYQKYIDLISSNEASDYLQLGIYYYRTAGALSTKITATEKKQADSSGNSMQSGAQPNLTAMKDSMAQYVSKADKAFAKVIEIAPDSYQGYYWKANANTLLDPDLSKGLANQDYLKMIEVLETSNDKENQSKLIEAYRYFSIYHLYRFDANKSASDKTQAKEYAEKVLQLKPDDDTSKKILEALNN